VAGAEARTGSHADRYRALREFSRTLEARLERLTAEAPVARRFVAGHSTDAGALATELAVANLRMLPGTLSFDVPAGCGLNFGVVTRATTAEAWAAAREKYPRPANTARVASRLAASTDSRWKAEVLSEAAAAPGYWRVPAQAMNADSPFYVGSYEEVAGLLADLRRADVSAVLLDLLPAAAEYAHLSRAVELVPEAASQP